MFAYWQIYVYFNVLSNNVNKKMAKKELFLTTEIGEEPWGMEIRLRRGCLADEGSI